MPSLKSSLLFLVFVLAAVTIRIDSFLHASLDWDEAVYLLMARSLRAGHAPYVEIFDHKPPGIYALFAVVQSVFGTSLLAVRACACLAVATTSYQLFRLSALRDIGLLGGVTAAALYMTCSLENGGSAANTEIFFAPLISYAFCAVLRWLADPEGAALSGWRTFTIGLACGCALQIKYVVVFDVLLVLSLLVYGVRKYGPSSPLAQRLWKLAPAALGIVLPWVVVVAYFAASGHVAEYLYANFGANAIHARDTHFSFSHVAGALQQQVVMQPILWSGAALVAVALGKGRIRGTFHTVAWLAGAWLLTSALGSQMPRRLYLHYFLQVLPALCLLTGVLIAWLARNLGDARERRLERWSLALLLLSGTLIGTTVPHWHVATQSAWHRHVRNESHWGDPVAEVAAYARDHLSSQENLYVFDYEPILYLLLDRPVPSRYAFPPFLINPHFSRVAGVDAHTEVERILATRPALVVMRTPRVAALSDQLNRDLYREVQQHLAAMYSHEATVADSELYRLNGPRLSNAGLHD